MMRRTIDMVMLIVLLCVCLPRLVYSKGEFSFYRWQFFMKFFKMCIFRNSSGSIRIFMSIVPLCRQLPTYAILQGRIFHKRETGSHDNGWAIRPPTGWNGFPKRTILHRRKRRRQYDDTILSWTRTAIHLLPAAQAAVKGCAVSRYFLGCADLVLSAFRPYAAIAEKRLAG